MAIIGITPCNRLPDYVESIRRAGGDPRVLSIADPPSVDGIDGLLFTGGGDVDPAHYLESPHPKTETPDAARDAFELELARLALAADTPMLAVCRGLQVINVAAGGTLIQDIPSEVNQALSHQIDTPLSPILWPSRPINFTTKMPTQRPVASSRPGMPNSSTGLPVTQAGAKP